MRSGTTFIPSGLDAILKLGVHLPKMGVSITETGSARTIYLCLYEDMDTVRRYIALIAT